MILRRLGVLDYQQVLQRMQTFTLERDQQTEDEIWIVEHPAVYTLGLSGKSEHLLDVDPNIPVIKTDRGGQVTYHGVGQLVVYPLLDINRLTLGVRRLVTLLEQAMISTLAQYGIKAVSKPDAPGVYVDGKKIGSVGLRVKKGACYHGLSFNNDMDLSPFNHINTCGFPALAVTQLADLGVKIHTHELAIPVVHSIIESIKQ